MKHFDEEEAFHAADRKQSRKEKKQAQKRDRSQFKKSDLSPSSDFIEKEHHLKGKVLSISGEGSCVDVDGKTYLCSLKGFLKKEKTLSKNLIAVGDVVFIEPSSFEAGTIVGVAPRYSFLSRTDISGKKEQIIAVNIDLVVICLSLKEPTLKPALIDRYLIAAEKGRLHPLIVINKIDLLDPASSEEKQLFQDFLLLYESLGIPIVAVSVHTGVGIESLRSLLQNKTSVFAGQSGVGKSSLLNACFQLSLRTGDLSLKTAKGAHTTTMAQLIRLPQGGYCIDTPGIRSFGLWKLTKDDVIHHFAEFQHMDCKYPDCTHRTEPNCAVLDELEKGKISSLRYESYVNLLEAAIDGSDKITWD